MIVPAALAQPATAAPTPFPIAEQIDTARDQVEQWADQAREIDSAQVVDQARQQLSQAGIATPKTAPAITDAIDSAVNSAADEVVNQTRSMPPVPAPAPAAAPEPELTESATAGAPAGAAETDNEAEIAESQREQKYADGIGDRPAIIENPAIDPSMRWVNDPISKFLAGKPNADFILHRVPGSWFDAPRIPEESNEQLSQGKSLYGPGTPIFVGENGMCTLAVAGTDAEGHKVGITAGHCGKEGDNVASADSWQVGNSGTIVASRPEYDYSVVEFGSNAEVSRSYNSVTVDEIGGRPQPGSIVCKDGVSTGHTCGVHYANAESVQFNQVCASRGDSGGPLMVGNRMVGVITGGLNPTELDFSCRSPLQGPLHVPTMATDADVIVRDLDERGGVGAGFKLPEN